MGALLGGLFAAVFMLGFVYLGAWGFVIVLGAVVLAIGCFTG